MRLLPDRRRGMGRRRSDAETTALREFLHDLGENLTALSSLVALVRDAEVDDVTCNRIELIEQELGRLGELVRDKVAKGPEPGVVLMTDLVIGDDHTLFAEALAGVLTTNSFIVRAVATSISGVLDAVRTHRPGVCLLDRHFVDGDAVDAIGEIIAASAGTRVLILTADNDMEGVTRALRSGAQGYVHKSSGFGALAGALTRVMADDGVVVEVPGQRATRRSPDVDEARRLAANLTARERECLALIVEGLGTQAMAQRLGVSNTTVRTHSQRLLTKLGVHSRLQASSFAVRYSLLDRLPMAEGAAPYARWS